MSKPPVARRLALLIKRGLDFLLSLLAIMLLLPVMLAIALIIRWDSPGPVIYAQERFSWRGRVFRCYKFRTMYTGSDQKLAQLLAQDPSARLEWERYRKLRCRDPRVTRVGRFLRRHGLDELPQLFNVLKGEMSLIGPRPYLVEEQPLIGPELTVILQMRPGITGLWQVLGKSELPFQKRVRLEAWYVRHWSLRLDLAIVVRTVRAIVSGRTWE